MTIHELNTVHIYLMDYAREHALTDEEFHLVVKMLKDVRKKHNSIMLESLTTEELEHEYKRRVEARLARKPLK